MSVVTTGADTYVNYLWEDNGYASDPNDSAYKTFGADVRVNSLDAENQAEHVYMPGTRIPIDTIEGPFRGRWDVEFTLTNPWWLGYLFGEPTTTGSSAPYTHTYDDTSTDGPLSARLVETYADGDVDRVITGAFATQLSLRPSVGDQLSVTLSGMYSREYTEDPSSILANDVDQTQPEYRPMTFAQANVYLDGDRVGLAQDVDVTVQADAQEVMELGDRFMQGFAPGTIEPTVDITKLKEETSSQGSLARVYGDTASSGPYSQRQIVDNEVPMTLEITNGKTGNSKNSLTVNLEKAFPDSYSESNVGSPEQPIEERVSEMIRGISAVAENADATAK